MFQQPFIVLATAPRKSSGYQCDQLSDSAWEADDATIRSKAVVHDQKPTVAFGSQAEIIARTR
jgi:hypothetical protein